MVAVTLLPRLVFNLNTGLPVWSRGRIGPGMGWSRHCDGVRVAAAAGNPPTELELELGIGTSGPSLAAGREL
jgi:hypothetical protein